MSGLGSLVKAAKAARKAEPFYSAVDEAAMALTRGKGTGKEFMTELAKTKGVKPTEIKERGLQKIESMPKMTKEEFLAELEKRPAPQIKETVFGELDDKAKFQEYQRIAEEEYGRPYGELDHDQQMDVENLVDYDNAQYGDYKLEGGKNYREILLKLPAMSQKETERLMSLEAQYRRMSKPAQWAFEDGPEGKEMKALQDKSKKSAYYSPHWESDQPNVLAHIRVQDRTGPNGEKVLHVEEIQSDWHQAGRKKGYKGDYESESEMLKKRDDLYDARTALVKEALAIEKTGGLAPQELIDRIHGINDELRLIEERKDKARGAVPDAPFKKNWHELAMKRVLNYAAENGYDRVAITPGATQAERYDLSKQINEISYGVNPDGTYSITAIDKNNRPAITKSNLSQSELEDTVGKEVAQKIIQNQGAEYPAGSVSEGKRSLSGLDLQVGGEGMKGFYDKMLPDYLNSYGKKYGVQVQMEGMPAKIGEDLNFPEEVSRANNLPAYVPAESVNLHSFDITPEMRQEITGKGLPLYQQIGIPTGGAAAGMGALEQEDQGFKKGGKIKKRGQVKFASNPDTMWLELMSRS